MLVHRLECRVISIGTVQNCPRKDERILENDRDTNTFLPSHTM